MLRWNLAGLVLVLGAGVSWAQDTLRLGGAMADVDTIRLGGAGAFDADTELVHRRGWGYGYYGRGYGYYGRGYGYHRGYFGRPYHYGHYYPRYGWGGYYRPYYSSFYYRPYFYRPFAYSYYYSAPYSYYSYPSYFSYIDPCVAEPRLMPEATHLGTSLDNVIVERAGPVTKTIPVASGTYRYDGGPKNTVPMPGGQAAPVVTPPAPALPRGYKLVNLPAETPAFAFPAYGETTPTATPTTRLIATTVAPRSPTIGFPAYGEK